ncbi:hypothetical protein D3C72_2362320 [compost metagenome]
MGNTGNTRLVAVADFETDFLGAALRPFGKHRHRYRHLAHLTRIQGELGLAVQLEALGVHQAQAVVLCLLGLVDDLQAVNVFDLP